MKNDIWKAYKICSNEEKLKIINRLYDSGLHTWKLLAMHFGVTVDTVKRNMPVGFDKEIVSRISRNVNMAYLEKFRKAKVKRSICFSCIKTNQDECCWFQKSPEFPDGSLFIYKKPAKKHEERFVMVDCPYFEPEQ